MDIPASSGPQDSPLPPEVQLIQDAIACRSCIFFWDSGSHYGPFPGFNWKEDYPAAMQEFSGYPDDAEDWNEGISMPKAGHPPTVLEGCRKAPILTLGVNPKLHAQRVNPAASAWCYPQFYDEKGQMQVNRYAYYHRYKTIYQESFDPKFIQENLEAEGKFIADRAGWLLSAERVVPEEGKATRQIRIKLLYDRDDTAREYLLDWESGEHYVLFVWPNSEIIPTGVPQFQAGEVIAGKIDLSQRQDTRILRDLNGYYERMLPILDELTYIAGMKLKGAKLRIGEDVCQMDMISCASPGWGEKYDLKGETAATVEENCISMSREKAWSIRQFLQTRPAVLMFVSLHSLDLFHRYLHKYFPQEFSDRYFTAPGQLKEGVNAFQLLKDCHENSWYLEVKERVGEKMLGIRSRILIAPHFSFPENYLPQVRFPEGDYEAYKESFPYAAQLLESGQPLYPMVMKRVHPLPEGGTSVRLLGVEDPAQSILGPDAWGELIDSPWYVDPNRMAAEVLMQELNEGNLDFNHGNNSLERTEGSCNFCDNAQWKFPGGCAYQKTGEPDFTTEEYQQLVRQMIGG